MKIAVGSDSAQHIGGVVVGHLKGKDIDLLAFYRRAKGGG
jgi:hypothetical protein